VIEAAARVLVLAWAAPAHVNPGSRFPPLSSCGTIPVGKAPVVIWTPLIRYV
jgi:hypothetical protein